MRVGLVRRQRVHQCLIRPALILGMAQKPALLLLAILGAQFTAGGISPLSLGLLAFDVVVLYPLLVWLGKDRASVTFRDGDTSRQSGTPSRT